MGTCSNKTTCSSRQRTHRCGCTTRAVGGCRGGTKLPPPDAAAAEARASPVLTVVYPASLLRFMQGVCGGGCAPFAAPGFQLAPPPPRSCRPVFVDIDEQDHDDPMACTTYVNDIFDYLRDSEVRQLYCRQCELWHGCSPHAWLPALLRQCASVLQAGLLDSARCRLPAMMPVGDACFSQFLACLQLKRRPTTTYMESVQSDINPMMRSILLDWLVEVGQEYRLTSDTLFLAATYIDRFLSLVDVKRNRLQLVGVTSMLVAAKYEEIYAPQVEEFCYITDNTYTREQVGL